MLRSSRSTRSAAASQSAAAAHRRTNPRTALYCLQFPLPKKVCCNGCRVFASSPTIGIDIDLLDDPSFKEIMDDHLVDRACSHASNIFKCIQPWNRLPADYMGTKEEVWIERVKAHISEHHGRIHVVETVNAPKQQKRMPQTEQEAMPPQVLTPIPQQETASAETEDRIAAITPNVNSVSTVSIRNDAPTPAAERIIAHAANPTAFSPLANPVIPVIQPTVEPPIVYHDQVVTVQGQTITWSVPNGYVLIAEEELLNILVLIILKELVVNPVIHATVEPTVEPAQKKQRGINYPDHDQVLVVNTQGRYTPNPQWTGYDTDITTDYARAEGRGV